METNVIKQFNKVLSDAFHFLPDYELRFSDELEPRFVEHSLQLYRAGRKFNIPTAANEDEMHVRSWLENLADDTRIDELFVSERTTEWISRNANLLRSVRLEISRALQHFSVDWSSDPGFGPGEQFISSGGKTSEFDKLAEHTWTCTEKSFPYFARAMYANRSTRRLVWKRCDFRFPLEPHRLAEPKYRFDYFCAHLYRVTEIVLGNRYASVFKDLETRRGICIETLGSLMVQKGIGASLKRCHAAIGNDLWNGQHDHARLLADRKLSTIDFSRASDSIHMGWISLLFPKWFVKMISDMRSPYTLYDGSFYVQNKVSSMGNGFTFELMSLLLLAVAKVCGDKTARVYGDDVIINSETAPLFIDVCEHLGFQVNTSKSFVDCEFRESCGSFHYKRYLESFSFEYITNALSARATLNKIFILSESNYWFRSLWEKMIALVPKEARGPVPDSDYREDNLSAYFWDSNFLPVSNGATRWLEIAYQRPEHTIHAVVTYQPVVVDIPIEDTSIHNLVEASIRIRDRMKVVRAFKQDTAALRLQSITIFVDNQGFLMTKQRYKNLRGKESTYLKSTFETDVLTRDHWAAWHLL